MHPGWVEGHCQYKRFFIYSPLKRKYTAVSFVNSVKVRRGGDPTSEIKLICQGLHALNSSPVSSTADPLLTFLHALQSHTDPGGGELRQSAAHWSPSSREVRGRGRVQSGNSRRWRPQKWGHRVAGWGCGGGRGAQTHSLISGTYILPGKQINQTSHQMARRIRH